MEAVEPHLAPRWRDHVPNVLVLNVMVQGHWQSVKPSAELMVQVVLWMLRQAGLQRKQFALQLPLLPSRPACVPASPAFDEAEKQNSKSRQS